MNNDKTSYENIEQKIRDLENEKNDILKKLLEEKKKLKKDIRSDFLTGGLLASSLFLMINSLILYFGILFPFDFFFGVGLFLICLYIILKPVRLGKWLIKYLELKESNTINEYITLCLRNIDAMLMIYNNSLSNDLFNYSKKKVELIKMNFSNYIEEFKHLSENLKRIGDLMDEINFSPKLRNKIIVKKTQLFIEQKKRIPNIEDDLKKLKGTQEFFKDLIDKKSSPE